MRVARNSGPGRKFRSLKTFGKAREGATAIEFAVLALPFFLFAFGIMGIGLEFFTINAVEHGTESASRKIRTGQAQKQAKSLKDFRKMVCEESGSYIDCDNSLVAHVQSGVQWSDITPRPCLSGCSLAPASGNQDAQLLTASGGAEAVVLVTVCYEWKLAQALRFLNMSNMSNGSTLIQSAATFRTEPYQ